MIVISYKSSVTAQTVCWGESPLDILQLLSRSSNWKIAKKLRIVKCEMFIWKCRLSDPSWCLQYYIVFSPVVGFLNGNKWDWSGDHERPSLISQSHNDKCQPPIGQRKLAWPDFGSLLVNISTLGSVSAHIKILINKIQELELRLETGNLLFLQGHWVPSSTDRTPQYLGFVPKSLLKFLNWNNKSFNGETKKFSNKI